MSDEAKPFAWAVIGDDYEYATLLAEHAGAVAEEEGGMVIPLYRSPTLTDFERASIMRAIETLEGVEYIEAFATENDATAAATLRGLLERLGGGVR